MTSQFFPMTRGDKWFLVSLFLFAGVSFLPWSRSNEWNGMAMQGWMMALLMVLAPSVALVRLVLARRTPGGDTP